MTKGEEDYPYIHDWTDMHLEVYCLINKDYVEKKEPTVFEYIADKEPDEWPEVPNPNYDPTAKPVDWPEGCKRKINLDCLDCEYVAYCEMDIERIELEEL